MVDKPSGAHMVECNLFFFYKRMLRTCIQQVAHTPSSSKLTSRYDIDRSSPTPAIKQRLNSSEVRCRALQAGITERFCVSLLPHSPASPDHRSIHVLSFILAEGLLTLSHHGSQLV
jgi:hypothetical protein